ncbi:MAG: T9SS type A sorting domain-containing protein, partial [Chitinophagaceae bacterium]
LSYTTGAVLAPTYYRMGVTCSNSNLTTYSAPYYLLTGAPIPSTITGPALYCPGDTATYAVAYVVGTTYTWTLPSGWSGTSTTNSILATPGLGAGTISVVATSSCGVSVPQSRVLSLGSPPAVPTPIQGSAYVCSGTSQTYTVTPVAGAKFYTWTMPSGWTGTSTTNSITTTVNTTSGTVSVIGTNGCGSSSSPRTLYVNVITTLPNPGTITGKDTVCSGFLQTYKIVPVPGATSYTWSYPNGWSGTTTDTTVQVFPGINSGNIQVVANAPCAYSPISMKAITSIPTVTPSVSVNTTAGTLCAGIPILFTATPTNGGTGASYQWQKNGSNVPYTGQTYTDNLLKTGDSISVVMTSSLRCTSVATAKSNSYPVTVIPAVTPGVSINTTPIISICQGVPLTFTTTSVGTGTAPIYQWYKNGSIISGANSTSYTDAGLINKDTITIGLVSNAVCATALNVLSNKVGITVTNTVIPNISITASTTSVQLGDLVTFSASYTGGGATPAFQWRRNGVNVPGETNDTYTSSAIAPGDHIAATMYSYYICATPRLVSSNDIAMDPPLGIQTTQGWLGNMSLYPNPTSGQLTLSMNIASTHVGSALRVEVMNTVGQVVYVQEMTADKTGFTTALKLPTSLSNGTYMLRIMADGARASAPFVLSR